LILVVTKSQLAKWMMYCTAALPVLWQLHRYTATIRSHDKCVNC